MVNAKRFFFYVHLLIRLNYKKNCPVKEKKNGLFTHFSCVFDQIQKTNILGFQTGHSFMKISFMV